jgi:transposase InsO family protein
MAQKRRLTNEERETIRMESLGIGSGSAFRRYAEKQAARFGCDISTIYRTCQPELRARKKRSDAGAMKALDEEEFRILAALTVRLDLHADLAIQVRNQARAEEGLPPLEIHEETLRRHLRERGVSRLDNRTDKRPYRRFEASGPNVLYQMDSTTGAQWYIDADGRLGYEPIVARNKNKPGNGRTRIWLIALVDDFSRTGWARFTDGNGTSDWLNLIIDAMTGQFCPDRAAWPAYGIPQTLYTDQDMAIKSGLARRVFASLGVEVKLAEASTEFESHSRSKGKVERFIGTLNQEFEKLTKVKPFRGLEEANRALLDHLIYRNNRRHSSTGWAPFERWLTIDQVQLAPSEEILRRVSLRSEERKIYRDLTIKLDGRVFQLPNRAPFADHGDRTVPIRYHEADTSTIWVVLDGEEHEVAAVEAQPDVAGEYQTNPTPAAVELKRELLQVDLSGIDPAKVFRYQRERDERTYVGAKPTVEHPLTAAAQAARMVRRGPAIDQLQKQKLISRPPTAEERALLDAFFNGRSEVPDHELTAFMDSRRGGGTERHLRVEQR